VAAAEQRYQRELDRFRLSLQRQLHGTPKLGELFEACRVEGDGR
jgi:hypothetical protein